MYPNLIGNNLISSYQSGFKGGDSCSNELVSITPMITHEIYIFWWKFWSPRSILDIFKAFDWVWLYGLIFKLQKNGISGKLLLLLKDVLRSTKQRMILNGQHSSWRDVIVQWICRNIVQVFRTDFFLAWWHLR